MTSPHADALPAEIEARVRGITWAQRHSLCTYLQIGWTLVGLGGAGEVEIALGEGVHGQVGYIRDDGIYRPA